MLHKLDNVAADIAAAAVENVFLGVDGEAIFAAALWAWANILVPDTL
jgi:hypothetical protein